MAASRMYMSRALVAMAGPLAQACVEHAKLAAVYHYNRGAALLMGKRFAEARDDCQRAGRTRFSALHALGRHAQAADESEQLLRRWG